MENKKFKNVKVHVKNEKESKLVQEIMMSDFGYKWAGEKEPQVMYTCAHYLRFRDDGAIGFDFREYFNSKDEFRKVTVKELETVHYLLK